MTEGDLCAVSRFPEKRRGRLRNHMEGNESRIKYSADERECPGNAAVSVEDPHPHGNQTSLGQSFGSTHTFVARKGNPPGEE